MKSFLTLLSIIIAVAVTTSCTNNPDDNIVNTTEILNVSSEIPLQTTCNTTLPIETPTENPEEVQRPLFDNDITFNYEYVNDKNTMPYMLFSPSTDDWQKPLIVWLHGLCERNVDKETFLNNGLPHVLNNWTLDGFDAYILCPQLTSGLWHTPQAKNNLQILIDKFVSEYNVDTENIVIVGHSSGGQGAMYMAHELPNYFSKLVVLSGYYPNADISEITIPTIGYVGSISYGEYEDIARYMTGSFLPVFGKENMFYVQTWHSNVPYVVFNEDKDEDGCSDIIKWMFCN